MEIYYIGGPLAAARVPLRRHWCSSTGWPTSRQTPPGGLQAAGNRTWCTEQHEYDQLMERYGHLMQ